MSKLLRCLLKYATLLAGVLNEEQNISSYFDWTYANDINQVYYAESSF